MREYKDLFEAIWLIVLILVFGVTSYTLAYYCLIQWDNYNNTKILP